MEQQLTAIKILLAEIRTDLRHHIKRTELLEGEVKTWREELKPIQKHITMVEGVSRILIFIAAIATAVAGVITVL